jgi:hypothetical protein
LLIEPSGNDAGPIMQHRSSAIGLAFAAAVRAGVLAAGIYDEARLRQRGTATSISFPLPTCTFEGGLCGALNIEGSVAVAPQFDWVDKFHEGRARVRSGGRYGYVDTAGRLVVEPQYDIAGTYWRGYAEVSIDGKSALIDPQGRQALEPRFARAHPFTADVFWVLKERATTMANKVWPIS